MFQIPFQSQFCLMRYGPHKNNYWLRLSPGLNDLQRYFSIEIQKTDSPLNLSQREAQWAQSFFVFVNGGEFLR